VFDQRWVSDRKLDAKKNKQGKNKRPGIQNNLSDSYYPPLFAIVLHMIFLSTFYQFNEAKKCGRL
jgi:hypothetical protein